MNMPISTPDLGILLVSLAACGYCFVLSRRLRALQNTKEGLGATITALSNSISDMSVASQHTRARVGDMTARLSNLLIETKATQSALESLLKVAEDQKQQSVDAWQQAHDQVETNMISLLEQSRDHIVELARIVKSAQATTEHFSSQRPPRPANAKLPTPKARAQ